MNNFNLPTCNLIIRINYLFRFFNISCIKGLCPHENGNTRKCNIKHAKYNNEEMHFFFFFN